MRFSANHLWQVNLLSRLLVFTLILIPAKGIAAAADVASLEDRFQHPPEEAKPWVIWYWFREAASKEGITADLEAMAEVGLGGAYLMPVYEAKEDPWWTPPVKTLSEEYWELVRHSVAEAERLGLKLGFHVGAGFSLAGGPWITPQLSMQRVVWTEQRIEGGRALSLQLPQPEAVEDYYRDIAVFAVREADVAGRRVEESEVRVTSSLDASDLSHLSSGENNEGFRMYEPGWILFEYEDPVTVRSVRIRPLGKSYQALRLRMEASDDGETFRLVKQFLAPRHGWQDGGFGATYSIPETTAKVFRFVYDPEGSEPGAEDLDWAKWKPSLKVKSIELSSAERVNQFEGKSAAVWRVADWTEKTEVTPEQSVRKEDVLNISGKMDADGTLRWDAPEGKWTIYRMGHTSTGATNYNGAAGKGLEADKLNPAAIALQFDSWFGETRRQVGAELFDEVVEILHSDSWEAESQNWTAGFETVFEERRGYDPLPYLPAMAGVVVESAARSEQFLYDLRKTIAERVNEAYFETLSKLAHEGGYQFTSESVSPTMVSDNLRHHGTVDLPMGEFWLRSPTHDKPMDMRDAVSGGRIYGKQIIQAEAFTQLRIAWDEAPWNIKALGDLHYALGVNKFVFHVFMQTPWVDREPGVSLGGVGLFYQRGQTWWKQSEDWVDYLARSQALLQAGKPVVDVAVFAGEELPSRAVQPGDLVNVLPGILGESAVKRERERLDNSGLPLREAPKGVKASANIPELSQWIDPLNGYDYDSLNLDVLLKHARVENGRLLLDGGASYGVLVIPGKRPLNPTGGTHMSTALCEKLLEFAKAGLPIVMEEAPVFSLSASDNQRGLFEAILRIMDQSGFHLGKWTESSFTSIGVDPDIQFYDTQGSSVGEVAWTHRTGEENGHAWDLYFVSNQMAELRDLRVSLRATGRAVEVWNAVDGSRVEARNVTEFAGRTDLDLRLHANQSLFLVLKDRFEGSEDFVAAVVDTVPHQRLDGPWEVDFPGRSESVIYKRYLESWTQHKDDAVKHFSGTAVYSRRFEYEPAVAQERVWLDLGAVADIATVHLNGERLGTVWTAPWQLEVSDHLLAGENEVRIEVTNTWGNALMADHARAEDAKQLWTNAPYRLEGDSLRPAGLLGPVLLRCEVPHRAADQPPLAFPEDLMREPAAISPAEMQAVYEEVKTPYKYGVVLKGGEGELLDCPNVFRHGDKWYMMFVGNTDGVGYETFLAESDDLLNWKRLDTILPFAESGWDKWQGDGGVSLMDHEWGGSLELQTYEGKYWMSYIGGSMQGYETDPLSAGLAWTEAPHRPEAWTRYSGNPILTPNHEYGRPFEAKTVYKSHIVWDKTEQLGWPFVMYYNGKEEGGGGVEAIGMAVSRDMKTWRRYGDKNVVYNIGKAPWAISGDPQIVKIGDLWVMFYFGAFWKPDAFDTFAVSRDMVNWTKWDGPHLIEPSEPFDKQFAHKPWVIKHDGVVYHFYCAVGEEGRVIALATSKDLKGRSELARESQEETSRHKVASHK
ncbi:DNA-binding protein [Pelagicoccus sp. NFK12]|uniref:DNA-binding protein n=1 Tax=Pelagicoccus enzymogenes TaxID=2773457 RepID=A0A927F7F4_9BACT|nr:DNA-binding protein [Pelagicoccus enzymogenes]